MTSTAAALGARPDRPSATVKVALGFLLALTIAIVATAVQIYVLAALDLPWDPLAGQLS